MKKNYVMMGINVIEEEKEEEENYMLKQKLKDLINLRRGRKGKMNENVEGYMERIDKEEKEIVRKMI